MSLKKSQQHNKFRSKSFHVENLEPRALMAADVDLHHGVLTITGTNKDDHVVVDYSGSKDKYVSVTHNGTTERFRRSDVESIEFNGRNGDDYFKNSTSIKSVADGGKGNDVLKGGSGKDILFGGSGDDELRGGKGADELYGESGNDILVGNSDNDLLDGGDGNDELGGSDGDDTLHGGKGNDVIEGESGDDMLYGDKGDDVLIGGKGNDQLFGGSGNDGLIGFDGYDHMDGGSGADRILTDASRTMSFSAGRIETHWKGGEYTVDSEDAAVRFANGSDDWTEAELKVVDQAFHQLQDHTENTRLLKDSDGQQLVFVKEGQIEDGTVDGRNDEKTWKSWDPIAFTWDHHKSRRILVANWNASKADANEQAISTVIHEIGHNWDSSHEMYLGGLGQGGLWKEFANISWKNGTNGQNADDFARPYGMTNKQDDWSTMWERYVKDGPLPGLTATQKFADKLAVVDTFFDRIGRMG